MNNSPMKSAVRRVWGPSAGVAFLLASPFANCAPPQPVPPSNFVNRPAVFDVSTDVVNSNLEPFNVTIAGVGNTLMRGVRGSFEPTCVRHRILVGADSPNRVIPIGGSAIHMADSYASGYLDGAEVRVYRVVNGELKLVREDKVPKGGTVISEWNTNFERVVAPDVTEFNWKWDDWMRDQAETFFTVFAMDKNGNISAPATPVRLEKPENPHKATISNPKMVTGKKTSTAPEAPPPPAPTNLRVEIGEDKAVKLTWDPVPGDNILGYFMGYAWTDPSKLQGTYLQLADTPTDAAKHLKKGDMVIVSLESRNVGREIWSSRVAGDIWNVQSAWYPDLIPAKFYPNEVEGKTWRLVDHPADTPVTDPGKAYLEMTLREGDKVPLGTYVLGGKGQDYYLVPEETSYTVEVWMKCTPGSTPRADFEIEGPYRNFITPNQLTFSLTDKWEKYTATIEAKPAEGQSLSQIRLILSGPGTFCVDNFRVYRSDTPYLDLTEAEYARLSRSGMKAMRTHAPIKTGMQSYSMEQYTNPAGVTSGIMMGNTLPQMLRIMEKAKVHPWLQIEYHMSPAEWLGFVEFMTAPYDPAKDTPQSKPWAYKRFKQGHARPWTDSFERIYFELSNETWNGLFRPWVFLDSMPDEATGKEVTGGNVYGMMQEHVLKIMRSSPYWNDQIEKKFIGVIGGRLVSTFGFDAANYAKSASFVTVAAYNGGWDEKEGTPKKEKPSYFTVLTQTIQSAIPWAQKHATWVAPLREQGRDVNLGTYEAGPGYALNGLNNDRVTPEQAAQQEDVMKSKTAGTATLDSFLARAYYDFDLQNFFMFKEGPYWSSHSRWYRGGQAYPSFLALELFNTQGTGDMLKTQTKSVPTVDLGKFQLREAIKGAPLAAAYSTRQGQRVNLFCISRKVAGYPDENDDGYSQFQVNLPFKTAQKITLYRLSGDVMDENIYEEKVKIEAKQIDPKAFNSSFSVGPSTGADVKGLPPGEAYLYVFEGTDIGTAGRQVPLSETAAEPYAYTQ